MLEVAIRRWVHCDHEGMRMVSHNTQIGCGIQSMIDWYQQEQSVPIKHSSHHYTTATSPDYWHKAG